MQIISNKPLKPEEKPSCQKTVPSLMQEKPNCYEAIPSPTRGKPGPKGDAATIEVVAVHTVEPTDPARVENVGDANAAKLEFYIPKGDPGNNGRDYALTPEDKKEIADMIEVPDGPGSSEVEIPDKLPNPFPVIINGVEYDGSERVEIEVSGSTEDPGVNIPEKLPNPQPITINGVQYDGSEKVEIEIKLEIESGYVLPEPGNYGRLFILLPGGEK